MSQKTNPTSLRLLRNETSFHSSWFSDFFYGEIALHENETRLYLEKLFKETNYSCPLISLQNFYRKSPILLFLHDIRATRREKEFFLRVPRNSLPLYATHFCEKQGYEKRRSAVLQSALQRQVLNTIPFLKVRRETFVPMVKNSASTFLLKRTAPFVLRQPKSQEISKALYRALLCTGTKQRFVPTFVEKSSVAPLHPGLLPSLVLSAFWRVKQTQSNELFFVERALNYDGRHSAKQGFAHSYMHNALRALHFSVAKLCRTPQLGINLQNRGTVQSFALYGERPIQSNAPATLCRTEGAVSVQSFALYKPLQNAALHAATAFTFLEPIRVVSDVQNAWILLDQIVNLLQKRAAFRQIKQRIFNELSKNTQIKGVRLTCRGRFGGRSKKAQKSKMQKDHWGETSLHAFSSRVSFVSKNASTPFGKIGIKLWLSFV